ncbi:hypothetical protein BdWA1_002165 [Babesia duncani]|uniref:Uncharacterized protein n=1 Tax=Babesia duncani TaxID=323732 RepID=A0AAD9UPF1_9APIC|nr:hypothetical protein BdWA1_002165 [Babesia duncani]
MKPGNIQVKLIASNTSDILFSKLTKRSYFLCISSTTKFPVCKIEGEFKSTNVVFDISKRHYGNLGSDWGLTRNQYTKYRISKPWTSDSTFDDIYLAEPSREDFYCFTKDLPIFLRYLDLLTRAQDRKQAFLDFTKRCENGLVVERDVYITKKELLDCMWSNGYSEEEIKSLKLAFPDDYQFHYPELAVLFDLQEEDCYRFCVRQRASKPEELVQLKLKKPQNMISSYGLVFLGCWFGLCNSVLGNAWFFAKTLPFGAVFYMLAAYFQKGIKEYLWKEEHALVQNALEEKHYCEAAIYKQLCKYFNDKDCARQVVSFKPELIQRMQNYRMALISKLKREMTDKMHARLRAMALEEGAIASNLEMRMVQHLMNNFWKTFATNETMKSDAITAAIADVSGETSKDLDPVFQFVNNQLKAIEQNDTSVALVQECHKLYNILEAEFVNSHSITAAEHEELKDLANACTVEDGSFDLLKLTEEQMNRLTRLYSLINSKMGYYVPQVSGDFIKAINTQQTQMLQGVIKETSATLERLNRESIVSFLQATTL